MAGGRLCRMVVILQMRVDPWQSMHMPVMVQGLGRSSRLLFIGAATISMRSIAASRSGTILLVVVSRSDADPVWRIERFIAPEVTS